MSIMVNSNKTPTGKTSKGKVSIYVEKGRIKARLPRQYFGGEQPRIALGMDANEANMARAQRLAERMTLDLQDGCFDETLAKYGIIADLKLKGSAVTSDDQLPPKPELSLMEVWDMYCEYRKQELRESTYERRYQGQYKNFLKSAIEATESEDALKIRNWLVENRNLETVTRVLSHLSRAYQRLMRNRLLTHNPFEGMAEEIVKKGARGKTQEEVEVETDDDVLDRGKAYTWDEIEIILEYAKKRIHWFNFLKFKFFTGCRTGEAVALMWCDIEWDKERVLIRRTYDSKTKKFYHLKNDKTYKGLETRRFPMPKNEELWSLLKSIPQGEPNEVVFKPKRGKIIDDSVFYYFWKGSQGTASKRASKGIIPTLIEQGKLSKYLPPYNTRHTFITHAIFDLGIDEKFVSKWCGHQIEVSNKRYQDVAIFAEKINPHKPQQQSEIDLLKEQLRQQQELINKLLQDKDK